MSKPRQSLNFGEKKLNLLKLDTNLKRRQGTPLTMLLFSYGHLGLHAHVQRRQRNCTMTILASSSLESVGLEWIRVIIHTARLKNVK